MKWAHHQTFRGLLWIQLAAGSWSLLCWDLSRAGQQPSAPSPFADHYLIQAALLPLLLGLQWTVCCHWIQRLCRKKSIEISTSALHHALGLGMGLSILIPFVLPDWIVWKTRGFDALGQLIPITAPLCLVVLLATGTRIVETQAHLNRYVAASIFCRSLFVASLPILVLIR